MPFPKTKHRVPLGVAESPATGLSRLNDDRRHIYGYKACPGSEHLRERA